MSLGRVACVFAAASARLRCLCFDQHCPWPCCRSAHRPSFARAVALCDCAAGGGLCRAQGQGACPPRAHATAPWLAVPFERRPASSSHTLSCHTPYATRHTRHTLRAAPACVPPGRPGVAPSARPCWYCACARACTARAIANTLVRVLCVLLCCAMLPSGGVQGLAPPACRNTHV